MIGRLWYAGALLALGMLMAAPSWAGAAPPRDTFVLAIGNNAVPADSPDLAPLRYADDDAARVYELGKTFARRSVLLAVLDVESQRRFPGLRGEARPPTLANLDVAVAQLRAGIQTSRSQQRQAHLIIFYSGHGGRDAAGHAQLTFNDGGLTQERLYETVLGLLPANYIHVLVDACHAEGVVQPRSVHAQVVPSTAEDLERFLSHHTLARFPHVGAVVAATAKAETHEWDAYRGGVLTHQLLSGLRGAADVNGDARVEYSELYAFLASANAAIVDARSRLTIVARPPRANGSAEILDLRDLRGHGRLLVDSQDLNGPAHIEDEVGDRLVDFHAEPRFRVSLYLPAERRLYLRAGDSEAAFTLREGAAFHLAKGSLLARATTARGGLEDALRRGLFRVGFGAAFYQGVMTQRDDFPSVAMRAEASQPGEAGTVRTSARNWPSWLLLGAAAASASASVTSGALALSARRQVRRADYERAATEAQASYRRFATAALITAGGSAVLTGLAVLLWKRDIVATEAYALREGVVSSAGATWTF